MVTDEFGPFDQAMTGPPTMFLVFFGVVATVVVGTFVFTAVKLFSRWRADQAAPLRSIDAMVVSRRTDVRRSTRPIGGPVAGPADGSAGAPMAAATVATSTSTSYFVTFEEPSGERRELQVRGRDYGQLTEGDRGHLIHQGSRYKGFTRQGTVDGIR
ncbi:hypothetical protein GCM10009817_14630 [Terrabacter lapilli]|uniref:DUF2500 family protein n=1 Tax=Terrabacter lapilli TaxID=436231 RepID=A0ABN2RV85_9MICO